MALLEVVVAKDKAKQVQEVLDEMVGEPPTLGKDSKNPSVTILYYSGVANERAFSLRAMQCGALSVSEA